jgi:hypothetical protein
MIYEPEGFVEERAAAEGWTATTGARPAPSLRGDYRTDRLEESS